MFWHIFWHSIWHIFWHIFWHSIWHSIWQIFWHMFWQTFWHIIWHTFWHSIWHSIWHTFWHSIWHIFWHSIWQTFWHFIWHIFWHSFWHSIWHIFWHSIWLLRSSGAHWARKVPGWGPAVRTELGMSQVEVQRCALSWEGPGRSQEVQRCALSWEGPRLRSSGAHWAGKVPGWGPAVRTELGRSQVEVQQCALSSEVGEELGEELARRKWRWKLMQTWSRRNWRRRRRRRRRTTALIKSNNPHLAGGEQIYIIYRVKISYIRFNSHRMFAECMVLLAEEEIVRIWAGCKGAALNHIYIYILGADDTGLCGQFSRCFLAHDMGFMYRFCMILLCFFTHDMGVMRRPNGQVFFHFIDRWHGNKWSNLHITWDFQEDTDVQDGKWQVNSFKFL